MGGKAILYVVVGFGIIFTLMSFKLGQVSAITTGNFIGYYNVTKAHNIAVSGANMAANAIFLDSTWTSGYNNLSFDGGTINVNVQTLDPVRNIRQITSTATYNDSDYVVKVTLQPSQFSKFGYYSVYENGIYFVTGDTVWGPLHTQDYLYVSGSPVFNGKVTTLKGISKYNRRDKPIFNGGYQQGVSLTIPPTSTSTLETSANSNGHTFTGHDTVYLTFANDSVRYKYTYNGTQTSVLTSSFAPNGTIFADNAVLRLQGTVQGQVTVGASSSGSSGKGTIYLDGDITYKTDPLTNPSSTDLLGIVAQNNVYITHNTANQDGINIDAAIFAQNGGFGAQDYDTWVTGSGGNPAYIHLLGGVTQYTRLPVGTFGGWYGMTGFYKDYRYDNRFMAVAPPNYPATGGFEIISWYEQ